MMIGILSKSNCFVPKIRSLRGIYVRSSTTSTVVDTTAAVGAAKPVNVQLFPWKSSFTPEKWYDYLKSRFLVYQAFGTLHTLTEGKDSQEIDNILEGSKEALKCATSGIFRHQLMKDHSFGLRSKYGCTDDLVLRDAVNIEDNIALSEIFDEKLKEFYQYAIQKHCMSANQLLTYELLNVGNASVVEVAILLNTRRGYSVPRHNFQVNQFGVNFLLDIPSSFSFKEVFEKYNKEMDSGKDSAVRVKVNVDCTELFMVTNATNGVVIQGSSEPQKVRHELLLENHLDGKTMRLAGSWVIVDIDDWLEGNEFWAKERFERGNDE